MGLKNIDFAIDFVELQNFAKWIVDISDGMIGDCNDEYSKVNIPRDVILESCVDPISTIVESTFTMFHNGNADHNYLER